MTKFKDLDPAYQSCAISQVLATQIAITMLAERTTHEREELVNFLSYKAYERIKKLSKEEFDGYIDIMDKMSEDFKRHDVLGRNDV